MSRVRIITAAFCGVAVLGLSAAPALAGTNGAADPIPSYPAAHTDTVGQTSVKADTATRQAPVEVKAVQISRNAPTQPAGALAFTGSDAIIGGLVLGSGLVVVGGGLVLGGRRKRESA